MRAISVNEEGRGDCGKSCGTGGGCSRLSGLGGLNVVSSDLWSFLIERECVGLLSFHTSR